MFRPKPHTVNYQLIKYLSHIENLPPQRIRARIKEALDLSPETFTRVKETSQMTPVEIVEALRSNNKELWLKGIESRYIGAFKDDLDEWMRNHGFTSLSNLLNGQRSWGWEREWQYTGHSARELTILGVILLMEGKIYNAPDFFQLAADKGDPVAQYYLARHYHRQGYDVDKAKSYYEKAIEGGVEAYYELGALALSKTHPFDFWAYESAFTLKASYNEAKREAERLEQLSKENKDPSDQLKKSAQKAKELAENNYQFYQAAMKIINRDFQYHPDKLYQVTCDLNDDVTTIYDYLDYSLREKISKTIEEKKEKERIEKESNERAAMKIIRSSKSENGLPEIILKEIAAYADIVRSEPITRCEQTRLPHVVTVKVIDEEDLKAPKKQKRLDRFTFLTTNLSVEWKNHEEKGQFVKATCEFENTEKYQFKALEFTEKVINVFGVNENKFAIQFANRIEFWQHSTFPEMKKIGETNPFGKNQCQAKSSIVKTSHDGEHLLIHTVDASERHSVWVCNKPTEQSMTVFFPKHKICDFDMRNPQQLAFLTQKSDEYGPVGTISLCGIDLKTRKIISQKTQSIWSDRHIDKFFIWEDHLITLHSRPNEFGYSVQLQKLENNTFKYKQVIGWISYHYRETPECVALPASFVFNGGFGKGFVEYQFENSITATLTELAEKMSPDSRPFRIYGVLPGFRLGIFGTKEKYSDRRDDMLVYDLQTVADYKEEVTNRTRPTLPR